MVRDSARKNGVDWSRVKQVFSLALEASPEDQRELIEQECGDDEHLKGQVNRLLHSHESADAFLVEHEDSHVSAEPAIDSRDPTQIGPYAIDSLIGEGGFGRVYRASQAAPI